MSRHVLLCLLLFAACSAGSAYCQLVAPQPPQLSRLQPVVIPSSPVPAQGTAAWPGSLYRQPSAQPLGYCRSINHVQNAGSLNYRWQPSSREQELDQVRRDISQLKEHRQQDSLSRASQLYEDAFLILEKMAAHQLPYSLSGSVFLVENAYLEGSYPFEKYDRYVSMLTELCRQIMRREALDSANNLAINYAIQKLYERDNPFYDQVNDRTVTFRQLEYDFDNPLGEGDDSRMFVLKLLATAKGQCHSLPLLYLILAEKLGAKAYLSLSPNHSFVKFADEKGRLYNYETTNGLLVNDNCMLQSGYISSTAIRNRIYLDTLSQQQMIAERLSDLAEGYIQKYGYDGFAEKIIGKALALNPTGIRENMQYSNLLLARFNHHLQEAGSPSEDELPKHPGLLAEYKAMDKQFHAVPALGYQPMPKEMYEAWLQSVAEKKQTQETKALEEQFRYQMQHTSLKQPAAKH